MFNLWSACIRDDVVLEFDVTQANMPRLARGDERWLQEALGALGLGGLRARTWTVKPFRCNYYSDYPGESDWRDRWPEGWALRVELEDRPRLPLQTEPPLPTFVDALDGSWDGISKDPRHDTTALVIASFRGNIAPVQRLEHELRGGAGVPIQSRSQELRSLEPDHHQLRLWVELNLADSVEQLEGLVRFLKARGGAVNWREQV